MASPDLHLKADLANWHPDYRLEGLKAAAVLYSARHEHDRDDALNTVVLHAAGTFAQWLADRPSAWDDDDHDCHDHLHDQLAEIAGHLAGIRQTLKGITMSQEQLDTDVQALTGVLTDIQAAEQANTAAVQAVAAEIADLKNANPSLDLSGLEALINGSADGSTPGLVQAAADVTAGVQAVQGLVPAPPAGNPGVSN